MEKQHFLQELTVARARFLDSHVDVMFFNVFIACKRREVLPYFMSLLFLGRFSSLPPLSFTEPVLRMCHSFTAPSLWMGEERGKEAGREEQRLCGTV